MKFFKNKSKNETEDKVIQEPDALCAEETTIKAVEDTVEEGSTANEQENKAVNAEADENAHFGVLDVFDVDDDTDDIVVMAMVKGTIQVGEEFTLTNEGEEDIPMHVTMVKSIELGPDKPAQMAKDQMAALKLQGAKKYGVRKGTVGYARCTSADDVDAAYSATLGQVFISRQKLELTEDDREQLTITDLNAILKLYRWFASQNPVAEDERELMARRVRAIAHLIAEKILEAESIYVLINRETGEPHMFSRLLKSEDGKYGCTPPDIMLFTSYDKDMVMNEFPAEKFQYRLVANGDTGKEIYNYLGETFYVNGACGVIFPNRAVGLDKELLVPEPDYTDVPEMNIPVTNPDVERWLLLMGQMGEPAEDDDKLLFGMYYRFFCEAALDARFIIPMQHSGDIPAPDENGKTVLEKDTIINLAVREGKNGRQAVNMYTDWKRLRMQFDEGWDGMIQPIEGIINTMDVAINATKFFKAGCYIDKEMYNNMKDLKKK